MILVSLGGRAQAQDKTPLTPDQQARKLYNEGEAAFTSGRFVDAVKSFEGAYQLAHAPKLLWNIAQSWRRQYGVSGDVADLKRSAAVLRNYLELTDSDADRVEAKEALAEVEVAIRHEESRPRPAAPAPASAAAPDPERGSRMKVAGLVLGAAGVVLVGGGVAFTVLAQRAFDEIDQPVPGYVFNKSTQDKLGIFRPTGYAMLGVGAAAVVGAVALYMSGAREPRRSMSVVPQLSPSGAGLVALGTF